MPRPTGMRRDDYARNFFIGALLAALGICVLLIVHVALSAVAHASSNENAKADSECVTLVDLMATAKKRYPGNEIVSLGGGQAADFMTLFNAAPPSSNYIATEVLVVFHKNQARVVLFKNGCGYRLPALRSKPVQMWLKKILGTSA